MKQYTKSIKGKLYNYFNQRLRLNRSTRGWLRGDCTECGGKNTLGIHIEKRTVHCFRCDVHFNALEYLMKLQNFTTYQEVYKFLSIQQEYEAYEETTYSRPELKPVNLPDSFRLLNMGDDTYGRAARHYMKKRGFKIEELVLQGIGYCDEGKYEGYIVFPFYRNGNLIYFQTRKFMDFGPKMKNPDLEEFGIGKTQLLYNIDSLFIYNKIRIFESITNCLTMGNNTVGILGKSISDWQFAQILSSPCEKLSLILDPDAWVKSLELGLRFAPYKKVKLVKLPEDKDANDLGKKKTLQFEKAAKYMTYSEIYKLWLHEKGPINTYQRKRSNYSSTRGVA